MQMALTNARAGFGENVTPVDFEMLRKVSQRLTTLLHVLWPMTADVFIFVAVTDVQAAKGLPITQGQDGVHKIISPAQSSALDLTSPSMNISRKPRNKTRPQRVYIGTNTASLKNLPRESMCSPINHRSLNRPSCYGPPRASPTDCFPPLCVSYPNLHQHMRNSLKQFEKLTRDVGKSKFAAPPSFPLPLFSPEIL
jgi:hypothetical protein